MAAQPPAFVAVATAFFEAVDCGKGWEACVPYANAGATFESDAFPGMSSLQDYAEWMKGLVANIAPDSSYKLVSKTWNDSEVTIVAIFKGTHTLPGGPVPPSDPPKQMSSYYAYTLFADPETGKIKHMVKTWNKLSAFQGWGWPIA